MYNYALRYHKIYADRITEIVNIVKQARIKLSKDDYIRHPSVKLLARLAAATLKIIPCDPNCRDYLLKGPLSKFRRYKARLQRYRLLFCFSNKPSVIVYLYINDDRHVRKDNDKNDPYQEFQALVEKGVFSSDPSDLKMHQWIRSWPDSQHQ